MILHIEKHRFFKFVISHTHICTNTPLNPHIPLSLHLPVHGSTTCAPELIHNSAAPGLHASQSVPAGCLDHATSGTARMAPACCDAGTYAAGRRPLETPAAAAGAGAAAVGGCSRLPTAEVLPVGSCSRPRYSKASATASPCLARVWSSKPCSVNRRLFKQMYLFTCRRTVSWRPVQAGASRAPAAGPPALHLIRSYADPVGRHALDRCRQQSRGMPCVCLTQERVSMCPACNAQVGGPMLCCREGNGAIHENLLPRDVATPQLARGHHLHGDLVEVSCREEGPRAGRELPKGI